MPTEAELRGRQALPGSERAPSRRRTPRLPAPGLITSAREDAASVPREAQERSNDYTNLSSITSRLHKRRRAFPTGLDSTPMGSSAPLPRTTLLPAARPGAAVRGSSLLSPPACTKPLLGASRRGTERLVGTARSKASVHLAQTYNLLRLAPPAKGHHCTGAAVTNATAQHTYLFFLIAACSTA